MSEVQIEHIFASVAARPGYQLTVDLQAQTVRDDEEWQATFDVEPARRHRMLNGLDDIAMTLQHEAAITELENRRAG